MSAGLEGPCILLQWVRRWFGNSLEQLECPGYPASDRGIVPKIDITDRAGDGTTVSCYAHLVKVDACISEVVEIDVPLVTRERGRGRRNWVCIPDELGVVRVRRNINHNIRIVDSVCVRKEIADLVQCH
jgi:hypothetical protein